MWYDKSITPNGKDAVIMIWKMLGILLAVLPFLLPLLTAWILRKRRHTHRSDRMQ